MNPTRPSRRRLLRSAGQAAASVRLLTRCTAGAPGPSASPSPVSGGLAPVGLEFWLPGRQAAADALTPFHQQFVAETPAVSGVTVQLVPNETMMERLTASLAAGTPP